MEKGVKGKGVREICSESGAVDVSRMVKLDKRN